MDPHNNKTRRIDKVRLYTRAVAAFLLDVVPQPAVDDIREGSQEARSGVDTHND